MALAFLTAGSYSVAISSAGSRFPSTIRIFKRLSLTKAKTKMLVLYDVFIKEASLRILFRDTSKFCMKDCTLTAMRMLITRAVEYYSIIIQYSSSSSLY